MSDPCARCHLAVKHPHMNCGGYVAPSTDDVPVTCMWCGSGVPRSQMEAHAEQLHVRRDGSAVARRDSQPGEPMQGNFLELVGPE